MALAEDNVIIYYNNIMESRGTPDFTQHHATHYAKCFDTSRFRFTHIRRINKLFFVQGKGSTKCHRIAARCDLHFILILFHCGIKSDDKRTTRRFF